MVFAGKKLFKLFGLTVVRERMQEGLYALEDLRITFVLENGTKKDFNGVVAIQDGRCSAAFHLQDMVRYLMLTKLGEQKHGKDETSPQRSND